jgi:flagellar basal body-associated protein FliL
VFSQACFYIGTLSMDIKDSILWKYNLSVWGPEVDPAAKLFLTCVNTNSKIMFIWIIGLVAVSYWRNPAPPKNKNSNGNNNNNNNKSSEQNKTQKIFLVVLVVLFGVLSFLFCFYPFWVIRDTTSIFQTSIFKAQERPLEQVLFTHYATDWMCSGFVWLASIVWQFRNDSTKTQRRILVCFTISLLLPVLAAVLHIFWFTPNQNLRHGIDSFASWIPKGMKFEGLFYLILAAASCTMLMQSSSEKEKGKQEKPVGEYLKLH